MKGGASGYELKRTLENVFSQFYNASFGTIYPMLSKLESEGCIAKEVQVQEGRPNKHTYTITEAGKQAFFRALESEVRDAEVKSDLMVRLFFGEWASPRLARKWLTDAVRKQERTLERLHEARERREAELSPTQRICMRIGIGNAENALRHLREGLAELAELAELDDERGETGEAHNRRGDGEEDGTVHS